MTTTTKSAVPILRPDEVVDVLLRPIERQSIAGQVSSVIYTQAHAVHLPNAPTIEVADWIPEGEEIPLADAVFGETVITPARLVGGSVVTREAIEDTSPEASAAIGKALADDIVDKLDASFFGSKGTNAERPAGLADLTGTTDVTAAAADGLDVFVDAMAAAEVAGANIRAWVAHPTTVAAATRAAVIGFAGVGALNVDGTAALTRTVLGVPVLSSRHVPVGTLYGFDPASTYLAFRTKAEVEADSSVFFTSYRVALRARIRVAWGFTDPAHVVKITLT